MATLIPEFAAGKFTAETPAPTWWPIRRRLEIAAEWARSPVLDVGAGTGWLALHLLEWGYEVTASDYDPTARANFQANAAIVGREVEVGTEDVSRLGYADGQFASLFCISVLSYVEDLQGALDELARVLRPGGIAVIGCLNAYGSYAFLNDRDPRTLFRRNRFRDDIRQDVEHFHGPRWWKREFARRFTVLEMIPLEVFSPLIAKLAGYDVDPRLTHADVRLAAHLPKEIASEVIYILRK
ncbi:MAG TPA: class I SAM-dependent methyltransferase [Solirubrobacteraceae bacterium]|jgi:SAM-dependent methyltransferase|nr:class I SAM-dependent methyltransferase [Solirubrobacteraceae bacterium]